MLRLVSQALRHLRVSSRKVLLHKDVSSNIRDNNQAINSRSRNRNGHGLLPSSLGPNPMDLPPCIRVRRS